MPWVYRQSTGELRHSADDIGFKAYSGANTGKNNPAMEKIPFVGPIPRGRYVINPPRKSARTGVYVLPLEPDGHQAHGRTAFQIHGESSSKPPGTSSTGCIILSPKSKRERIWKSNDKILQVIQ